jgi:NADH-quinone oxidoreductase subunit G
MPRVVIDDLEIEVPLGTKIIEAAERLGIMIPRFCYHEALGSVGACRMCAVKFLHGPFKGIQMSCMIDAQDGMVVSTTDREAVEFRKWVIELLMLNHPHDCPVCDEGGQCLLQDETVSGGHGRRRFPGRKRTYRDQYLGPYIQHEMNRCIHCYRCSRFYQEYAGYRDLGPLQIGNRLYFGRFSDGALESPYSGNLVDICPTGVYTDKTARFKVRRWDLARAPSLCINCSLGCNTVGNAYYRAIMRVEGRYNPAVNGYFICDSGRFGFSYTNGGRNHEQRPRLPLVSGNSAPAKAALRLAREGLADIAQRFGSGAIAVLGSARNSLETQCIMQSVCRKNGWRGPAFFLDGVALRKVCSAVKRMYGRIAVSMKEIEKSDFVIVAGADPVNEAPMAAVAIRQAWRKGAVVVVIDPRPVSLPMDFEHIPAAPGNLENYLGILTRKSIRTDSEKLDSNAEQFLKTLPEAGVDQAVLAKIESLAEKLGASKGPVIVCGSDVVQETTPAFAADCALLLSQAKGKGGVFHIFPGAGSYSSALISDGDAPTISDIVSEIEKGSVRALVAVESDPFFHYADRDRLESALARLELLVVVDYMPTELVKRASIFYPASTVFETGSTWVNQEGRMQYASRVHHGGIPIWGSHPERVYRESEPGGDHMPAWKVFGEIDLEIDLPDGNAAGEFIAAAHPTFEAIRSAGYPADGVRIVPETSEKGFSEIRSELEKPVESQGLELLLVERIFGTNEFLAYSDSIKESITEPVLLMHANDALKAGLADGDRVMLGLENGELEVRLSTSNDMAEGVLILPRHQLLDWRKIRGFPVRVPLEKIKKGPA